MSKTKQGGRSLAELYAAALYAVAEEADVIDRIEQELTLFCQALEQEPRLQRFLEMPTITPQASTGLITQYSSRATALIRQV